MERYSMLTDWKYLVQPSSEKLPPTADGKRYKHPQPDNVQSVRDLGTLNPKQDVSIKSLLLGLREVCARRDRKGIRDRRGGWRTPRKQDLLNTKD